MAVTKILAKNMRIDRLVNYIVNPDKTEEESLVTSLNCNVKTAAKEMANTKEYYGSTGGVQAYHIIQSFRPDEISPELAHEIGVRFCEQFLNGYEVVIGTHVDKDHIHNHIGFNSVSRLTGKKYTNTFAEYYKGIRVISDRLCRENGLSVIMESGGKGLSYAEWKLHKAGLLTYRDLLAQDVEEALSMALDVGNFYELMENRGYAIVHHSKYPSFIPYGSKSPYRAKINGRSLTEDDIRSTIEAGLEDPKPEILVRRRFIPYERHGKQHGFRALYVSWMYVLGIIGQGHRTSYPKVDDKELRRFEQYKKQQEYLETNEIDTDLQLTEKINGIEERIRSLTKARTILNAKKKRMRGLYKAVSDIEYLADVPKLYLDGAEGVEDDYKRYLDAKSKLAGKDIEALKTERSELYTRLSDINAELRKLRREQRLCAQIQNETPKISDKLNTGKVIENIDFPRLR